MMNRHPWLTIFAALAIGVAGVVVAQPASAPLSQGQPASAPSVTTLVVDAGIMTLRPATGQECALGIVAVDAARAICLNQVGGSSISSAYIGYSTGNSRLTVSAASGQVVLTGSSDPGITMGTGGTVVPLPGTIVVNTTAVGNVGASGPDDLQSNPLPANSLTSTGRCVKITAIILAANNVNAKTTRLVFGAAPIVIVSKQITVSNAATVKLTGVICRTGLNAQRYWGEASMSAGTTTSTTDGVTVAFIPTVTGTSTETETNAIPIKTQSTTSTGDNDVVSQILQEEYY